MTRPGAPAPDEAASRASSHSIPLPPEAMRIIAAHVRNYARDKAEGDGAASGSRGVSPPTEGSKISRSFLRSLADGDEPLIQVLSIRVTARRARPAPGCASFMGKAPAPMETADISAAMSRAEIARHYSFAVPLLHAARAADLKLIVLLQLADQNYCVGFCRDVRRQNRAAAPPSRFKERRAAGNQDVSRSRPEKKQ